MVTKQDSSFCCSQVTCCKIKDRYHLRVNTWKKKSQTNRPKKQAYAVMLVSDNIDFKPKIVRSNRGYYILMKEKKIHQEHTAILDSYAPNTRATKFIKEARLQVK